MVAIVYGSSTLNTEFAAQRLHRVFGEQNATLHNVRNVSPDLFAKSDSLILMTSTWGAGDMQDDWEEKINELAAVDLSGTSIALVGLGDQDNYPDTFCDSLSVLYDRMIAAGATIVGATSQEGYQFVYSKAVRDGMFVGLVLDEDNQADQTDQRIRDWVALVKPLLQP